MNLEKMADTLRGLGYAARVFDTAEQAAQYLDEAITGKTVGFGGSMTLEALNLWERLRTHNAVYSHLHGFPAGPEAGFAQVYVTSVNGMAETGEMVLIDGFGNRAAAVLFGHEKVYFVVGRNKIAKTYDEAVRRARNIASPLNARRKEKKTPCAVNADRCYDCKSADRICRAMVTLWRPMDGFQKPMEAEVVLIDEDLGF